jgi:transglutaminase-like putative cysteine protease
MHRKAIVVCLLSTLPTWAEPPTRHFQFEYAFTISHVPAGQQLRLWFPMAHSDAYQDVQVLSIKGDLPLQKRRDPEYGNWMFYAAARKATQSEYRFAVVYDIRRKERVARLAGISGTAALQSSTWRTSRQAQQSPSFLDVTRFLQADRLVPTTGLPAELATGEVAGAKPPLDRARAIYDYVLHSMRYDKTGSGWGRGDVLYACATKKGNCTDFHSLFIAMARSQGIPARFEIGFQVPAQTHAGVIPGYHCWADFYVNGSGWIPVDISEAWKDPSRENYFFGAHDFNRVQFTIGRDIRLWPPQERDALNYFIYPYAEVSGKEHTDIVTSFSFEDARGPNQ